jgi:hypothetical protein
MHTIMNRTQLLRSGALGAALATAMCVLAPVAGAAPPSSAPSIKKITPATGPGTGGTEVKITGSNLSIEKCRFVPAGSGCPNLIVYFGFEPGLVVAASKKEILLFAPEQFSEVGSMPVTVVTPSGISGGVPFTYTAPPVEEHAGEVPVVSEVVPNHGSHAGFSEVRIKGSHLTPNGNLCVGCNGDVVHFGTKNVAVAQGSATELRVFTPPSAAGTVDVTVTTNPGGTSATGEADHYTYE